jgi:uncharacterized protein YpmB
MKKSILKILTILFVAITAGSFIFWQRALAKDFEMRSQLLDNIAVSTDLSETNKESIDITIDGIVKNSYVVISNNDEKNTSFLEEGGSKNFTIKLKEGNNQIKIYQYIVNGEKEKESKHIEQDVLLDLTPPTGTAIFTSAVPAITNNSNLDVEVELQNSDTKQFKLNYQTFTVDENNKAKVSINLSQTTGRAGKTVILVDSVGNETITDAKIENSREIIEGGYTQ